MTPDATDTNPTPLSPGDPSAPAPAANGQLRDLLARFQRDLDVQAQVLSARESHVRDREGRLVNRRERLAQMAMAIKNQRAKVVEMEVDFKRKFNALQFSQDSQAHQARQADDLHRQAEQAHEQAQAELAKVEREKLDFDRQAKAIEHRQAQLDKQQQQLTAERESLTQLRDQAQAAQADLDAQREAFAREQAQIEKQLTDREAQVSELEAIEQALRKREAAVKAAEESLEESLDGSLNQSPADSDDEIESRSRDLETRAAELEQREREQAEQQAALEHELEIKLEDVQAQQAQLETLQRQWDQRLAELEARESPIPLLTPDDSALSERQQALDEREQSFQKKRDKTLHDLLIQREQLAKEQRRNDRLHDRLENRRAQVRRSRKLLRERWSTYYEQTANNDATPAVTPSSSPDTTPAPRSQSLPKPPRLMWLSPSVLAAMVVGLVSLGAASYFIASMTHPPLYVVNARLSLQLPASMTASNSPLVSGAVLSGAMDRLAARNLQPFPDAAAMRASLTTGAADFTRIGEDRFELTYTHTNRELAVFIVEAWSEALIASLNASAQTGPVRAVAASFLRRPVYDPTPLAASRYERWKMIAILFGVSAPLYLILMALTARRRARMDWLTIQPQPS